MTGPYVAPLDGAARKPPCPVCCGAGYWFTASGVVTYTRPVPPDAQRCTYCLGTGEAPKPMGRVA